MASQNTIKGLYYNMMRSYREAKNLTICEEWLDRDTFIKWAYENGYEKGFKIFRRSCKKGYYPDNCYFAKEREKQPKSENRDKRPRRLDITGMKSGKLTAVEKIGYDTDKDGKRFALWKCECECGGIGIFNQHKIVSKSVKSCGCMRNREHYRSIQHGMSQTRIYRTYCGMKARCDNPNDQHYKDYGGRGIKICNYWRGIMGFTHFYEWAMKNGYRDDLTIDRIDVNGDYEPNNCRWATNEQQQTNKRDNVWHIVDGQRMLMKEISKKYNIPEVTIRGRMARGMTAQEAVYYRQPEKYSITYHGITKPVSEWSKETGIRKGVLIYRIKNNYPEEKMFLPVRKLHYKNQNGGV